MNLDCVGDYLGGNNIVVRHLLSIIFEGGFAQCSDGWMVLRCTIDKRISYQRLVL